MKHIIKKINGMYLLWTIVILFLTFQWFDYLSVIRHRTIYIAIGSILVIYYSKKYFEKPAFTCLMLYILIVLFNFFSGDRYFDDFEKIIYIEFFSLFFSSSFVFYLLRYNKQDLFNIVIIAFGVFLVHSTIVSTIAHQVVPHLIRLQVSPEAIHSYAYVMEPFRRMGLSDYLIPHALCVIIPGFVYLSKVTKGLFRVFFISLTVASWILSYVSCAFIALLLSTLSLALSLLVNPKKPQKNLYTIILTVILFLPVVISKDLQMSIINGVGSILPEESVVGDRITDLQFSLKYDNAEGDVGLRKERFSETLSTIANNFLIGTDTGLVGRHNALLDRLASLGLIGMIPFIMFLYFQIGFTKKYIYGAKRYYYYIGITSGFLMMLLKNMYNWSMWLFLLVFLPGMLCLANFSKEKIKS